MATALAMSVLPVPGGPHKITLVAASIASAWIAGEERQIEREILDDLHRQLTASGRLLAYARLLPPGLKGPQQLRAAIGRVLTSPALRGQGQGRPLVREALRECEQRWPGVGQELSAQAHLQDFYASLGFRATSPVYDEDGIPHIDMCRDAAPLE